MTFLINLVIRVPGIRLELPPFTFCDENLWRVSTVSALQENNIVLNEFRAGSINTYPVLFLSKLWEIIFGSITDTQVVVIGRALLPVLLGSATVFFIFKIVFLLTSNKIYSFISILLFTISPFSYAMSQYWYPDHYIYFFSSAFFYFLIHVIKDSSDLRSWIYLAVFFSFAVSSKYTAGALVLSVATFIILVFFSRRLRDKYQTSIQQLLINTMFFSLVSAFLISLLNFSAFLNPESFLWAIENTQSNYSRTSFNLEGIRFYSFIFLYMPLPGIGFILFFIGAFFLIRSNFLVFSSLVTPILFLIVFMGSAVLVINRNLSIFIPIMFAFSGIGLGLILEKVKLKSSAKSSVARVIISAIFIALPSYYLVNSIRSDLNTDSRVLAREWININIPAGSVVGSNNLCSAPSTADPNVFQVIEDGLIEKKLPYYVIDSFFRPSVIEGFYRSKGIIQEGKQKLHHYYFGFYDYDVFRFQREPELIDNYVEPLGYRVLARIKGAGPEIVILKKIP